MAQTNNNGSQPAPAGQASEELKIVHTDSLKQILEQSQSCFLVSTYQAGKLVIVRNEQESVNSHFINFRKPMGVAADNSKIAVGAESAIWILRNTPEVGSKIESTVPHDGCFLPYKIHVTGDIDIHEMTWADDELWFINTRFSCLCTMDGQNSFVPRWRPPFITGYDMRDRCHLNGLGLRDGKPRYVTALGTTDVASGWRQKKADGGILMDIDSNEIILDGLSMPHSPRWYQDRLWFLESGTGGLNVYDPDKKESITVATLPGFTRGLDFLGNLAFIGLSKVRETAVFSGIPLTKEIPERTCGVYVVDITSGEIVAFLRFETGVEEIFAVNILAGIRFPAILDWNDNLIRSSYTLPDEAMRDVVHHTDDLELAQPWLTKGNDFYNEKNTNEAINCYRKCLDIQPDFLPARFNLGVALGDIKQFDAAIEELKKVIEAESGYAEAHNSLGFVYFKKGNIGEAVSHYEQALKIRPDYEQAASNLNIAKSQLKDNS